MYDYTYDKNTGGLLLNDKNALLSKEPRPVYAQELDFLGIDKFWQYKKQQDIPYMWAEANHYIYRGENIFNVTGGSLYVKPTVNIAFEKDKNGKSTNKQVLTLGKTLQPIDLKLMCKKNEELMDIVEQITVKKIYGVYNRRKKTLDCFHVAFSGGKDSIVLLELVKRALPHSSFLVVFGDTKMEFPDTYDLVDKVEEQCKAEGINFYRACSDFDPEQSWQMFGPPSRVLRWCCTVHKSAPQTLKIREVLGKDDYVGLDFVGVRAHESAARAGYEEESYGKKQKGQYSHNAILNWSSAEVWMYIFLHNLPINEAYKKGNSRAGCLLCPMGGGKGDFFQYANYAKEIDKYISLIKNMDARDAGNEKDLESYVTNGGWNARKNGRDLTINEQRYEEELKDGKLIIKVTKPTTDWREWIKTLGNLNFDFEIKITANGYMVIVDERSLNQNSTVRKRFKQVFKKSAYCVGCRACESNCRDGKLTFDHGLKIDGCLHCGQCHEIDSGCLVYNSIRTIQGGSKKMKSINSFANHAPKPEWMKNLLSKGEDFWDDNSFGPNEVPLFKKFLLETGVLSNENKYNLIFDLLMRNGYEDPLAWGFMIANFAYNAQCRWYIDNMQFDTVYQRDYLAEKLVDAGINKGDVTSILSAFRRFCDLPFGTILNFGNVKIKGNKIESLERTKMIRIDPIVLLYSLYRYAEACEGYYQFTLTTLMDTGILSGGVSPVKIFGFERDETESMLRGLSAKYGDYINVTFTHDLEKIALRDYHSAVDVFDLI